MRVNVKSHLGDLTADLTEIPIRAARDMVGTVHSNLKQGNTIAKGFAKTSSGCAGKLYPKSFSAELHAGTGLFGNVISGEYGPDTARPQGGMSFEYGSRNQKPHLDLARSADIIGPAFADDVANLPDKWFW